VDEQKHTGRVIPYDITNWATDVERVIKAEWWKEKKTLGLRSNKGKACDLYKTASYKN